MVLLVFWGCSQQSCPKDRFEPWVPQNGVAKTLPLTRTGLVLAMIELLVQNGVAKTVSLTRTELVLAMIELLVWNAGNAGFALGIANLHAALLQHIVVLLD